MATKAAKFAKKMESASPKEKLAVVMTGLAGHGFTVQLSVPKYKAGHADSKSKDPRNLRLEVFGSAKKLGLSETELSTYFLNLMTWIGSITTATTDKKGRADHD